MSMFEDWVQTRSPAGHRPVFVAFNAAFDWMFIADYFERHLGRNPFGYSALDIKAFAMGSGNTSWAATSMDVLAARHLAAVRSPTTRSPTPRTRPSCSATCSTSGTRSPGSRRPR